MLTLITALLLTGPPPARADDGASPPAMDARDTDADGTVSGKERRTARRAARRARRGTAGSAMTDAELDAADAAESSARSSAAANSAAGAAASMKGSMSPADAGGGVPPAGKAGGGSQSTGASSPPPSSGPTGKTSEFTAGASNDPGHPKSPSDFALAGRSGYAPAFAAAGLKLGPDGKSVLRLDGKPATPEDYARLQKEINSMPAALGRRPDFFSVVSPDHYTDLKHGYKEKKEGDRIYKDVGTTEADRDFVHTASCSKLSGDCNKVIEKASYKKGDFVAPEDLDSMWKALEEELKGTAKDGVGGGMPSLGAEGARIAREKAMDSARALTDGGTGNDDAIHSAAREDAAPERTPVSRAVASVRRLWRSTAGLTAPEGGGPQGSDSRLPLLLGALALAALGAGALFLRRKG